MLISITHPNAALGRRIRRASRAANFPLISSILEFLEEYRFDGIELDWPTAAADWSHFKTLLRLIGTPLAKKGYTFAVALRPGDLVDPELASIVDLMILRSWRDFPPLCEGDPDCERADRVALHPSPLSYVARNTNEWIRRVGVAQRSKIVLALPVFGQGYTLQFGNLTDAGAPVSAPGREGPYTKRWDGKLAYYEVRYFNIVVVRTRGRLIRANDLIEGGSFRPGMREAGGRLMDLWQGRGRAVCETRRSVDRLRGSPSHQNQNGVRAGDGTRWSVPVVAGP